MGGSPIRLAELARNSILRERVAEGGNQPLGVLRRYTTLSLRESERIAQRGGEKVEEVWGCSPCLRGSCD